MLKVFCGPQRSGSQYLSDRGATEEVLQRALEQHG
jgi:hypothetical protein